MWTVGSAEGGVENGGAGALVVRPGDEESELRVPAGRLCSSFWAEMVTLNAALQWLLERADEDLDEDVVVICTDSQSALASLRPGPPEQTSPLGIEVWDGLLCLATRGRRVHLQWVPAHCALGGNERADAQAEKAAQLPQEEAALDVRTIHRASARAARGRAAARWPQGWYHSLMDLRATPPPPPPPVTCLDRAAAVDAISCAPDTGLDPHNTSTELEETRAPSASSAASQTARPGGASSAERRQTRRTTSSEDAQRCWGPDCACWDQSPVVPCRPSLAPRNTLESGCRLSVLPCIQRP